MPNFSYYILISNASLMLIPIDMIDSRNITPRKNMSSIFTTSLNKEEVIREWMVLGYINQSWNHYMSFGISRDVIDKNIKLVSINHVDGKVVVFCDFNSFELLIDIIFGVNPEEKIVIEELY